MAKSEIQDQPTRTKFVETKPEAQPRTAGILAGLKPGLYRCLCLQKKSETKLVQVVVADLDVIESGLRIVVFDEKVFDTGFAIVRENIFPVDGSFADVGEMTLKFDSARCSTVAAGGM